MSASEHILAEREGAVLRIVLNRPGSLNAISEMMAIRICELVEQSAGDDGIRAIVLIGAGDKAFSAGSDLKERRGLDAEGKWRQSRALWSTVRAIHEFPKPTIAAIGGWCLGGGLELTLVCDLRLASDDSVFGWPEMALGAYPGAGGPAMLTRIVGPAVAKRLLLFSDRIDAREALACGLISTVAPRDELLPLAMQYAERSARNAPLATAAVKRIVNATCGPPIDEIDALNTALRRPLESSRDYIEGIEAHYAKRQTVFKGR